MKFLSTTFATLLLMGTLAYATDWEEEEATPLKPPTHVRNYPGGADEEDLKVQTVLPQPGRYPDSTPRPETKDPNSDHPDIPND